MALAGTQLRRAVIDTVSSRIAPPAQAAPATPSAPPTMAGGGFGVDPSMLPMSGFRDAGAFQFLMQSLGLPGGYGDNGYSPPPAAPPPPPPTPVEQFGGMNFGSLFQNILGGFGSSAQSGGSRGPQPAPQNVMSQFMGPLGNGGGYLRPKATLIPRSSPKMNPRLVK